MNIIKKVVTVFLFVIMMMTMSVMVFADTEVTFHFYNARNWENVGGWIYEGTSFNKNVSPTDQSVLNASGGVLWPGAKCEDEGNGWFKVTAKFTSKESGAVLIFNNWTAGSEINDTATQEDLNQLAEAGVRLESEAIEQSPNIYIGRYVAFNAAEYWISWDGMSTTLIAEEGNGLAKTAPLVYSEKWKCFSVEKLIYRVIGDGEVEVEDTVGTELKEINIPESISYVGKKWKVTGIGSGAFRNCNSLKSIKIPDTVTSIGHCAFQECRNLTGLTIPEKVIKIGCKAFDSCSSLKSIKIPKGVVCVEREVFNGCNSLSNVTIAENVTKISEYAFNKCSNLRSITIPESVIKISWNTFNKCSNLVICSTDRAYAHTYAIENNIKWSIKPKAISSTKGKLSATAYTYNGTAKTPSVTITDNGKTLKKNTDYTVSYINNNSIGTASVTVTGKGNYTGIKTLTFKINPAKTTSLKQSATYTSASIKMSWAKVAGAAGYEVYRSDSKNGTYKLLKTVTTNSWTNSGLKAGSKYYYKVRAYKTVNGKKVYGAYSDVKSMITKPSAPPKVSAIAGSQQAKITWGKSSGANGYEVYMSTSKKGTYQKIKTVNLSTVSYTKTGLKKGQKYYFKVRAYKTTGTGSKVYSGWSSIKSIVLNK
ncbi:MAG: leucine-rich repeat protein [Lachnospiraceae bacterium]|nr:leucine-rich repeat protein [Lachnospiraceae bacterium]